MGTAAVAEKSTQCFSCKKWVPFGYVMWLKHLGQRETITICVDCHEQS